MADVFISYARTARQAVEPIKRRLEAEFSVYFDVHSIDGGEDFPEEIDRHLRLAKAVVGFWTSDAFRSKWCMKECRIGYRRHILVPAKLEPFSDEDIPAEFDGVNYIDLSDWNGDDDHEGWARLQQSLRRRIDISEAGETVDQPRSAASIMPPPKPLPPHLARWQSLDRSLDAREYEDFYNECRSAPQRSEARRRQWLLEAWARVAPNDLGAIGAFQRRHKHALSEFLALKAASSVAFEEEFRRSDNLRRFAAALRMRPAMLATSATFAALVAVVVAVNPMFAARSNSIDRANCFAEVAAPAHAVFLMDPSVSSVDPASSWLVSALDGAARDIQPHGRITVLAMTADDPYNPETIVSLCSPGRDANELLESQVQVQLRYQRFMQTLVRAYGGAVASEAPGNRPALFETLAAVSDRRDFPPAAPMRRVVFVSEWRDVQASLASEEGPLWGRFVETPLGQHLPDLSGVLLDVHIINARDAAARQDLRSFWSQYAQATGARAEFH